MSARNIPTREDIITASERVGQYIVRTPVRTSEYFNERFGAELFFKCENLQKGGAFKMRGATNAVFSLDENEIKSGVATHSSGNYAKALALAARLRGVRAYVVMPSISPDIKVQGVKELGAEVTFCESTLEARERTLEKVLERTGATFIHPYDDPVVIAGQATAAKELLEDAGHLDLVMAPVGGGGLLSGTSLSIRYFSQSTRTVGVEPAGADDAYRSFTDGVLYPSAEPNTVADGLRTSLSPLTFSIIMENVSRIITVSEESIILAMKEMQEQMEMPVEPSAAVPLAAIFEGKVDTGRRIGIIVSGGNVDPGYRPWATGDD
jgi:threonine dehydratase